MAQDKFRGDPSERTQSEGVYAYYDLLELPPTATLEEVRKAYRLKSKLYHPDTTLLPPHQANQKFRELNDAYATLSNPERRAWYDTSQQVANNGTNPLGSNRTTAQAVGGKAKVSASGYLDLKERALSPGELFAIAILAITFAICLGVAVVLGVSRGEMVLQSAGVKKSLQESIPAAITRHPPDLKSLFSPSVERSRNKTAIMEQRESKNLIHPQISTPKAKYKKQERQKPKVS